MSLKLIGAVLVVAGCAGVGFAKAAAHRREEDALEQFIKALELMSCELQYHLSPLPELCRMAAQETKGQVRDVLMALAKELEDQIAPDAQVCMKAALLKADDLPLSLKRNFERLGGSLGRFDMTGQIAGLESVSIQCKADLAALTKDRDARLRGYRTLGICAGAALAILFL